MDETAPAHPLLDRWFGPIEDRGTARLLARDLGAGLLIVAAVQAWLALAFGRDALADAALFAVSGALGWATAGRLAAALALVTACGSTALAIATLTLHEPESGGRSIFLGLVAVWIGGRAVVAALAYRRHSRAVPPPEPGEEGRPGGSLS